MTIDCTLKKNRSKKICKIEAKTLPNYKRLYARDTKGKSAKFKIGWLEGAGVYTRNKRIKKFLENEKKLLRKQSEL